MATLGRYELRYTLGQGGFATVYRAWDTARDAEVALKVLLPHLARQPDVRGRFHAEGAALASLRHPGIITVLDVDDAPAPDAPGIRLPFFAMELVEGRTLAEILDVIGSGLSPAHTVRILRSVAGALDFLHAAGYVHRDLKPGNVMLAQDGRVLLMDLGIARNMEITGRTQFGSLLGTPTYMSPEQALSEPVGPFTDVYALGVLSYEMLAGRPPFVGDAWPVLHAQVYESPPPLAAHCHDLPAAACAVVESALSKRPQDRPQSAGAFVEALTRALAGGETAGYGGLSPRASAPPPPRSVGGDAVPYQQPVRAARPRSALKTPPPSPTLPGHPPASAPSPAATPPPRRRARISMPAPAVVLAAMLVVLVLIALVIRAA